LIAYNPIDVNDPLATVYSPTELREEFKKDFEKLEKRNLGLVGECL
jgi:hypothetical protein